MNFDTALKEMPLTGPCTLNLEEVLKNFDDSCFLSQWGRDKFRLVGHNIKVTITKEDARKIIAFLGLNVEQYPVFSSGKTWKLN